MASQSHFVSIKILIWSIIEAFTHYQYQLRRNGLARRLLNS